MAQAFTATVTTSGDLTRIHLWNGTQLVGHHDVHSSATHRAAIDAAVMAVMPGKYARRVQLITDDLYSVGVMPDQPTEAR